MPSGNVTVTVEPGSAVPLTCVSSLVTSFTVGPSGAVVSTTVVFTESEILPLLSIEAINSSSPPTKSISFGISIVYFPSSSAVPIAVVPSGNVTVTSDPGSAVPLTCVSSLVISSTVGVCGAVASTTVVVACSDLLLALSCAIA